MSGGVIPFLFGRDPSGAVDYSLPPPQPFTCSDALLTATVVSTFTCPENYNRAFFSYAVGTNVYVTLDGTVPAFPASGAPVASSQELNPGVRQLNPDGSNVIKVVSDTASVVNVRFDRGSPSI